MSFFEKNLKFISSELKDRILNLEINLETEITKSGNYTFKLDSIYFHSKYDPILESKRLSQNLKTSENYLYLFFGAGLGYTVLELLKYNKGIVFWFEPEIKILKLALTVSDFSEYLKNEKLKIILPPYHEENLYPVFKGYQAYTISFVPHKPSFEWNYYLYLEIKHLSEKFFHKKNANLATLTKFEKIWTRNLLQNLIPLQNFIPIKFLFNSISCPVLITGAGPSLHFHLQEIKMYREKFLLIAVDTSLKILTDSGIEPDLIYSVDPQSVNTSYLETYSGKSKIIFDPTTSYHSLRMFSNKQFFTDSPFGLLNFFFKDEIGKISFGGSVSTNAFSLAFEMGATEVYLVGQDLAFTDGFAHCKGAILEERLNFKETRFFRREKHNFKQLFALPKLINYSYENKKLHTNDKMKIFQTWFEENSIGKKVFNLSQTGTKLKNIEYQSFKKAFENMDSKNSINSKKNLYQIINENQIIQNSSNLKSNLEILINELSKFRNILEEGKILSEKIYSLVKFKRMNEIHSLLKKIDKIDELVSSKNGLNEMIALTIQRTILIITEGYETNLSFEEKSNSDLGIAKKSILLYEGLFNGSKLILTLLKKNLWRLNQNE